VYVILQTKLQGQKEQGTCLKLSSLLP
jgi:hypothetical protein